MSKAFDSVKWPFLATIILHLGFCQQWVDLLMKCIKSTSFSFLIHGALRSLITSRRIQQGDPISPYLFLFYSEGLFRLLNKAVERDSIHDFSLCRDAPIISHLLFANDTMIFCNAYVEHAQSLKDILRKYELAS